MTQSQDVLIRLSHPSTQEAAMREFVQQFGSRLHRRCHQLVGNQADADDVFQNTLIKVVRNAASFDGRSKVFSWLYRIATNESLDFLRKQKRLRAKAGHQSFAETLAKEAYSFRQNTSPAGPSAEDVIAILAEALDTLPQMQRLVFEERYYHETPYATLATRLGKSEGGLKANYHHAVKRVTAFLREHTPIAQS